MVEDARQRIGYTREYAVKWPRYGTASKPEDTSGFPTLVCTRCGRRHWSLVCQLREALPGLRYQGVGYVLSCCCLDLSTLCLRPVTLGEDL